MLILSAADILATLAANGYASGNIVLGIGSFTYQYVTRDSLGTAIKATWFEIVGVARNAQKDPETDDGTKKSACGLLRVDGEDGAYVLSEQVSVEAEAGGALREVWRDGVMTAPLASLEAVRLRLAASRSARV